MVKRRPTAEADALIPAPPRQRRKVVHEPPSSEVITTSRQLRQLLAFNQDLRQARHGLQSFKLLLDSLSPPPGPEPGQLDLLREYLEAVKPRDSSTEEDAVFLPDIMETWDFAFHTRDEGVMSSAVVVLALLLPVLSSSLDLVPHGLGVCSTILQERQQKLLAANLSSEKNRGFIISPTLRLLREAVAFDGGAVARRLFRARSSTLASLARNLEIKHLGDSPEDPTRSSVRTNAVRLLLTSLKYLPSDMRKELVSEKHVISHLTFMLLTDPPYLVREILTDVRKYVLSDPKIPRDVKFRAFNTRTLVRFLALYGYKHDEPADEDAPPVAEAAHDFLLFATTDPAAGILYPCRGLYPKGMEDHISSNRARSRDDDVDDSFWLEKYKDEVPVFNFVLAEFIQKLRPWSSLKHNELLVAIFRAAPELASNYFAANKSFTFEPKLSMTWIGYAAFIFSTIQLSLPEFFGAKSRYSRIPPPTSVLLDNILPLPINQKVLVRCLSPDSPLIAFFATRLLVMAMEKLREALAMHQSAASSLSSSSSCSALWADAERKLMGEFCQRIPDLKDVMRSYRSVSEENALHREAASRLLLLYYEIVPQVALVMNLDVSQSMVSALNRLTAKTENQRLCQLELEHLISIASYSPGMKWFSKPDGLDTSPFTALVRLMTGTDSGGGGMSLLRLREALDFVAVESQLVLRDSRLDPLVIALESSARSSRLSDSMWAFLDGCASRCANSPIRYHELLLELAAELPEGGCRGGAEEPPMASLFAAALMDQLPYAVPSTSKTDLKGLASFLAVYLAASIRAGERADLLELIRQKAVAALPPKLGKKLRLAEWPPPIQTWSRDASLLESADKAESGQTNGLDRASPSTMDNPDLEAILDTAALAGEDTSYLTKWASRPAADLVDEGYAAGLVRLLLSAELSIRKEALTNILKMAAKIKQSSYDEKTQVWLLLSELAESCRTTVDTGRVPTCFPAFVVHVLEVVKNPLHCLYPKINRFLTRAPSWAPDRIPLAHEIFHGEPSEDDRYYQEISWFLDYLLDGLGTAADLATFHNRRVFEKVLSLGGNPYLRTPLMMRILRILYRATCIEGGSDTLATRFGAFSWLEARAAMAQTRKNKEGGTEEEGEQEETAAICGALVQRLWETCDRARISEWSSRGVERLVGGDKEPDS